MPIDPNAFSADEEKTIQPDPLASFRKKRPQLADLASFSGGGTSADDLSKAPLNAGEVSGPLGIPQSSEAGAPSLLATERVQRSPIATSEQATPLLSNPFERGQAIGSEAQRGEVGITGGVRGTPQMSTANRNEALMSFFRPQSKQTGQLGQASQGGPTNTEEDFQSSLGYAKSGVKGLQGLQSYFNKPGQPGVGGGQPGGENAPGAEGNMYSEGANVGAGAASQMPDFGASGGLMNLSGQINPEYMSRLFGGVQAGQGIGGGIAGGMNAPGIEGNMYSEGASAGAGGAGTAGQALGAAGAGLGVLGGAYNIYQGNYGGGIPAVALAGTQLANTLGAFGAAGGAGAEVGATAGTAAASAATTATMVSAIAGVAGLALAMGGAAALTDLGYYLSDKWGNDPKFAEARTKARTGVVEAGHLMDDMLTADSPAKIQDLIERFNNPKDMTYGAAGRSWHIDDRGLTGGYELGPIGEGLSPTLLQLMKLKEAEFSGQLSPQDQTAVQNLKQQAAARNTQRHYTGVEKSVTGGATLSGPEDPRVQEAMRLGIQPDTSRYYSPG